MQGKRSPNRGFSLLEIMISTIITLIMVGSALSLVANYQRVYQGQQQQAGMHQTIRGALELITQEAGQAGAVNVAPRQLSAPVVAAVSAVTVNLISNASLFVGEKLLVDTGAAQEVVTTTAVSSTSFTAQFQYNHPKGAEVVALGAFPAGVLTTASGDTLQLFGDVNADGTLVSVVYTCDLTSGTLKRAVTPLGAAQQNAASTLLSNVVANPGGTPCFQVVTQTTGGYTFVTSVTVTLTTQTTAADPQTGQFPTLTSSLTVVPRNVLMALALAQASPPVQDRLQPTPPGLPWP